MKRGITVAAVAAAIVAANAMPASAAPDANDGKALLSTPKQAANPLIAHPTFNRMPLTVYCADVVVVTVRGSGDPLSLDPVDFARPEAAGGGEQQKFGLFAADVREALKIRGKTLRVLDAYEYGRTTYPAVAVPMPDLGNAVGILGSLAFGGEAKAFQESFDKGLDVVSSLTNAIARDCPASQILLTGHSQGGGIISTAMARPGLLSAPDRVAGVTWADAGFRGDEVRANWSGQLPAPNAQGWAPNGEAVSSKTDFEYDSSVNGIAATGSLARLAGIDAFALRDPMPAAISGRNAFFSICHGIDFVCQADMYNLTQYGPANTHGFYAGFGRNDKTVVLPPEYADSAAFESRVAANRIVSAMFPTRAPAVATYGPQDIIFVIDRTTSMDSYIRTFRNDLTTAVASLQAKYGDKVKFGFVGYGDVGMKTATNSNYITEMVQQPTGDASQIAAILAGWKPIQNGGNRDKPEAMYAGVRQGMDAQWTPNATRTLIVLTDAGNRWSTSNDETAQSLAGRLTQAGVRLYGVVYGSDRDAEKAILDVTSGMTLPGGLLSGTVTGSTRSLPRLVGALSKGEIDIDRLLAVTNSAPPVAVTGGPYGAPVGRRGSILLSGAASYDPAGSIVRYQWDTDGDGYWNCDSTSNPTCSMAIPSSARTYTAQLRVTNDLGMTADSSVPVVFSVSADGQTAVPAPPGPPTVSTMPGIVQVVPVAAAAPVAFWAIDMWTPSGAWQSIGVVPADSSGLMPVAGRSAVALAEGPIRMRISAVNVIGSSSPTEFTAEGAPRTRDASAPPAPKVTVRGKAFMVRATDPSGLLGTFWQTGTVTAREFKSARGKVKVLLAKFRPTTSSFRLSLTAKTAVQNLTVRPGKVPKGTHVCTKAVSVNWAQKKSPTVIRCR